LGEFCWYLSGRSDFDSIDYYVKGAYDPERDVEPDGVTISGAYGPRLMGLDGNGQLEHVIGMLTRKATTRQAVLQLFGADDLTSGQRDVPCTCTIQLLHRDDRLEMVTYMRSNDVYKGLPHDVFCFTLLQEWIARRLGIEPGTYKHAVGSLHLYDENAGRAQRYLDEGFHSTLSPMPPMPPTDAPSALGSLLDAEEALRATPADFGRAAAHEEALEPYWADLVRLLRAFRHWKDRDPEAILRTRDRMASPVYYPFLTRRAHDAADRLLR
jgi:thymidylate synthase